MLASSCKKEDKINTTLGGIQNRHDFWDNGSVITVKFLDNSVSKSIQTRVEKGAKVWEKCANITFKFVSSTDDADLRIKIGSTSDASSMVMGLGKKILKTPIKDPNMVLMLKEEDTSSDWEITHEFGHVLGFEHAHAHPSAGSIIDYSAIWAAWANLRKESGMHEAEANAWASNFLLNQYWVYNYKSIRSLYYFDGIKDGLKGDALTKHVTYGMTKNYPTLKESSLSWERRSDLPEYFQHVQYDILSIMHYGLADWETKTHTAYPQNTVLSKGDIELAKLIYPR
jgi:hypothetical protein